MSVLLDKLRSAARARAPAPPPDHLAEGSLLSQALHRAEAERAAARTVAEAAVAAAAGEKAQEGIAEEPAKPPAAATLPVQPSGRGFIAAIIAMAILGAVIAIWHISPSSPYEVQHPVQPGLKLDHTLKGK